MYEYCQKDFRRTKGIVFSIFVKNIHNDIMVCVVTFDVTLTDEYKVDIYSAFDFSAFKHIFFTSLKPLDLSCLFADPFLAK